LSLLGPEAVIDTKLQFMDTSKADCCPSPGDTGGTADARLSASSVGAPRVKVGCPSCLQRWSEEERSGPQLVTTTPTPLCHRPQRVFTRCEVALHSTESDCWLIAHGIVYDVTPFLPKHPGGLQSILRHAGKESSEDYDFHAGSAQKLWKSYVIGRIVPCNPGDSTCGVQ
jgi:hypothetical protein